MPIDLGQSIWAEVRELCAKNDEDLTAYSHLLLMLSKSNVEQDRVLDAVGELAVVIERWSDDLIVRLFEAVGELIDLEGAE